MPRWSNLSKDTKNLIKREGNKWICLLEREDFMQKASKMPNLYILFVPLSQRPIKVVLIW